MFYAVLGSFGVEKEIKDECRQHISARFLFKSACGHHFHNNMSFSVTLYNSTLIDNTVEIARSNQINRNPCSQLWQTVTNYSLKYCS